MICGTQPRRTKLGGLGRRGAINRQTDRADLILWKTRETVANFWGPLTLADLRASPMASQNKLRKTSQNPSNSLPKTSPKGSENRILPNFGADFFRVAFWSVFKTIFHNYLEARTLIFAAPANVLQGFSFRETFKVEGPFLIDFASKTTSKNAPNHRKSHPNAHVWRHRF